MEISNVIPITGLDANRFSEIRFTGIGFTENAKIITSFNEIQRRQNLCYSGR